MSAKAEWASDRSEVQLAGAMGVTDGNWQVATSSTDIKDWYVFKILRFGLPVMVVAARLLRYIARFARSLTLILPVQSLESLSKNEK